jgi:hypothetical protein
MSVSNSCTGLTRVSQFASRAVLVGLVGACAPHAALPRNALDTSANEWRVSLTQVPDSSPDRWRGLSNIFFDSIPPLLRDSMRLSPDWRHVEAAEVVAGDGLQTILALRFTLATSRDTVYLVDTLGTLDFIHALPLAFKRRGSVRVASLALMTRSLQGAARRVPYQILLSDDKYTYARIAEFRNGAITVDGHRFAVVVRNRGRNNPFFTRDAGTMFFVDQDGDGIMAEQATLTVSGQPAAAEQVMPYRPFVLKGMPLEVTDIDSIGSSLRLTPARRVTAVSPNFRAPELTARRLAGSKLRLSSLRGRVVLLEFWATDCAFSERVREATNQLAVTSGEALAWVALTRERDRAGIEAHLVKHPMHGIVALADSAAWAVYNPELATPHFVVIDRSGVVKLVATGATAIEVVTAQVNRLLAKR